MPFVLDHNDCCGRPTKRRRLDLSPDMARTLDEDDFSPERETQSSHSQDAEQIQSRRSRANSKEEIRTSDRDELIQCIKRGQRPTWVPKPSLEALCVETNAEAQAEPPSSQDQSPKSSAPASVLPIALPDPIPRPPSALHAGDFYAAPSPVNEHDFSRNRIHQFKASPQDLYSASPPPWLTNDPYPHLHRPHFHQPSSDTSHIPNIDTEPRPRSRAPSLGSSLSSSFVMRVPTSPLVHATSSPASEPADEPISTGHQSLIGKSSRRRTLPSNTLMHMSSLISAPSTPVPTVRREVSAPYRTHQIRRSLTSFTYQPATSSQNVFPNRQRRLSHASETSPRHRSSMIGSFEESILRGRMSTPPSRPLDFVAQIGVLGKGNCPARLKCPAHVSVTFPAVFYSYPASTNLRTLSDDSPSPYVGTIDLETNLKPVEEPMRRKRKIETNDPEALVAHITGPANTSIGRALTAQQENQTGSNESKQSPIGGAYRVPQQGQLQVVIKNPNKTAVKLFLIPYDLEGMLPGSKTFVRQRSFSSGPVLEKAISTDPERTIQDPLSEKQVLRYLIHLKFCCLAKGRFYLYDNIRVVFANRVPEGKEKLRNEVQLPEPRYSPFMPGSNSRRQSASGFLPSPSSPAVSEAYDPVDGMSRQSVDTTHESPYSSAPIPFHLSRTVSRQQNTPGLMRGEEELGQDYETGQRNFSSGSSNKSARPQSPEVYGFDKASTSQRGSPVPWASLGQSISRTSSPTPTANGNGLLSRKLREMSKQTAKQEGPKETREGL